MVFITLCPFLWDRVYCRSITEKDQCLEYRKTVMRLIDILLGLYSARVWYIARSAREKYEATRGTTATST